MSDVHSVGLKPLEPHVCLGSGIDHSDITLDVVVVVYHVTIVAIIGHRYITRTGCDKDTSLNYWIRNPMSVDAFIASGNSASYI